MTVGCNCIVVFFFSSRSRHTRCVIVTCVQTCALPISGFVFINLDPQSAQSLAAFLGDIAPLLEATTLAPFGYRDTLSYAVAATWKGGLETGRASCRERGCKAVQISVVVVSLTKQSVPLQDNCLSL